VSRVRLALLCGVLLAAGGAAGNEYPPLLRGDMELFVQRVAARHGFDEDRLRQVLMKVEFQTGVIQAVSTPATSRTWKEFRPGFFTKQRIEGGVKYWIEHDSWLQRARDTFGVPEELIVAIIGVETLYGRHAGNFRVIDAIATLAFQVPARAAFFQNELEEYLLLCRSLGLDPLVPRGSYAGAMGSPQFIPSSYRRYARDFDGDGRVDLWTSAADAIGSVANYLQQFGWRWNGTVALRAHASDVRRAEELVRLGIRPVLPATQFQDAGVAPERPLRDGESAALMLFEGETGPEYWLGLDNFYVITRYNRSQNYAMAVWQLSQEIALAHRRALAHGGARGVPAP
jgi:membrane-bound lytic murein transglycosylase B